MDISEVLVVVGLAELHPLRQNIGKCESIEEEWEIGIDKY